MDGRPTWTDCDEAGEYVVPNVLSPRDLVSRPDNMDETVPHTQRKRHNIAVDIYNDEDFHETTTRIYVGLLYVHGKQQWSVIQRVVYEY